MNTFGPFQALEHRQSRLEQHAENSARLAQAYATHDTTGAGEFVQDTCIEFGLAFTEEPIVSYGQYLNGDQLVDTRFPRAHGFVYRWRTRPHPDDPSDKTPLYTGAWVAFVVDTSGSSVAANDLPDPNYTISHYFTFTGTAFKDLPDYLMDH